MRDDVSRARDLFDKRDLAEELSSAEAHRFGLDRYLDLAQDDEEHELARLFEKDERHEEDLGHAGDAVPLAG